MTNEVSGMRPQLRVQLADDLRLRIRSGEWSVGEQLPTEAELVKHYGVSRSTVRSALQHLENQGLTATKHGVGTFVTPFADGIHAGLQELTSITETLRAHGLEPGMGYRSRETRTATPDEQQHLLLGEDDRVVATERALLANGVTVAFSHDSIPLAVLPDDFAIDTITGSLFGLLESHGVVPRTAVTTIHAATGPGIGWGDVPEDSVYSLLKQTHYTVTGQPVLRSWTYFIEGRFQFSILRTR